MKQSGLGSNLVWEARQRGENFTKELDLVAINTLSVAASTGALVWLIAPNRSDGAVGKMPWQKMQQSMPNNLFDASTPYRQFSMGNRAASLVVKTAELCAVGSQVHPKHIAVVKHASVYPTDCLIPQIC